MYGADKIDTQDPVVIRGHVGDNGHLQCSGRAIVIGRNAHEFGSRIIGKNCRHRRKRQNDDS